MKILFFFIFSCLSLQLTAEEVDKVVVYKTKHRMDFLFKGKIVKSYSVMLGRGGMNPKKEAGDRLLPEGNYILDYKNPNSKFYKSIHISYPNAQDIERAKRDGIPPGGDIMIHGMPNLIFGFGFESWMYELDNNFLDFISNNLNSTSLLDWTAGCVALRNGQMKEVYNTINVPLPITIYH